MNWIGDLLVRTILSRADPVIHNVFKRASHQSTETGPVEVKNRVKMRYNMVIHVFQEDELQSINSPSESDTRSPVRFL